MQNPSQNMMTAFKTMNFHLPNGVYRVEVDFWDGSGDEIDVTLWVESKYRARILSDLNDM